MKTFVAATDPLLIEENKFEFFEWMSGKEWAHAKPSNFAAA